MKKILFVLICFSLFACEATQSIESFVSDEIKSQGIMGLTYVIVKEDQLVSQRNFGWANYEDETAVSNDTGFLIASVSKTITGVALMQLYERGEIDLDASVSQYLPFSVVHPEYPETDITARMLLTHTSGISDAGYNALEGLYTYGKDSPIELGEFLREYFDEEGKYYDEEENFLETAPGEAHDYSNMGSALVGYLVESIHGQPFSDYCEDHIFSPLGMDRTSWRLEDQNIELLATPYENDKPSGHYTFPDYPNGQLRTTARDLSRFLRMFICEGELEGKRILDVETVQLMIEIAYPKIAPSFGLHWYHEKFGTYLLCGHDGGEKGVTTAIYFDPHSKVGAIVLTNWSDAELNAIVEELIIEGIDRRAI